MSRVPSRNFGFTKPVPIETDPCVFAGSRFVLASQSQFLSRLAGSDNLVQDLPTPSVFTVRPSKSITKAGSYTPSGGKGQPSGILADLAAVHSRGDRRCDAHRASPRGSSAPVYNLSSCPGAAPGSRGARRHSRSRSLRDVIRPGPLPALRSGSVGGAHLRSSHRGSSNTGSIPLVLTSASRGEASLDLGKGVYADQGRGHSLGKGATWGIMTYGPALGHGVLAPSPVTLQALGASLKAGGHCSSKPYRGPTKSRPGGSANLWASAF